MKSIFILFLIFWTINSRAEIPITILQTSDIHSHYTNNDSPFQLGGIARVATKIHQLKEQNPNALVLDAGDFTEGSIFFTLDSGVSTHQIMEAMGYDAIVLGNHDWLIGPQELYKSLEQSQFKVPIVSSNLNYDGLDPKYDLQKYIKPYIIKEVQGVKVGILGLSTFQFVFDPFFLPVKLVDPLRVAQKYIDEMRKVQGVQVLIILSHLGFTTDRTMAQKLEGVDIIVGGHSHVLLKTPAIVNGVPITHVGKWGHYLAQIDLAFDSGKTKLINYKVHQIDPLLPEDPGIKTIVSGALNKLEAKLGPIFHDKIFESSVDLPIKDYKSENIVGHWIADAYRKLTGATVSFENPSYSSRDIFKGFTNTADFFNILPNGFTPTTNKAWTVKQFNISGLSIKLLLTGVYRSGLYLKMSNARVVLDLSKTINQISSIEINGKPLDNDTTYTLAATNGILEAIEFLKTYGIEVGILELKDTGKEAWRVVADYFHAKSPITPEKLAWEGRIRTLQPDVMVRPEEMITQSSDNRHLLISFKVRNGGMTLAKSSILKINRALEPGDTLSERVTPIAQPMATSEIKPGEFQNIDLIWDVTGMKPGRYPVTFELSSVPGEIETENNILDTYIDVP